MESSAQQLVEELLAEYRRSGEYLSDRVSGFVQLVLSDDEGVAEESTRVVFKSLVEYLADSFEPKAVTFYNQAFAQIIQACRGNPRAAIFDQRLDEFGLQSESDLIARAETLRNVSRLAGQNEGSQIKRIIVLSRVTLGADVAITSVILSRMKREFPDAEIVMVGGSKSAELFGGDSRLSFKDISYQRAGTTIERLMTWVELLERVQELTSDLSNDEYLVVDPDTRLTQLGLLPIIGGWTSAVPPQTSARLGSSGYLFFPSREYGSRSSKSLGELTSMWLDEVFGEQETTYPSVTLNTNDTETGQSLVARIRDERGPVVAINFGVGENQFKRISDEFEASLVARLIQQGATIVLDKGAGADEIKRADAIVTRATAVELAGRRVQAFEIDEQSPIQGGPERLDADILVWDGRIGVLAGLIAASDLYIGYDSAGQHIAAAVGVPCIDVFAGFGSRRMLERWRPTGKAETALVVVDKTDGVEASELVDKVLAEASRLLR